MNVIQMVNDLRPKMQSYKEGRQFNLVQEKADGHRITLVKAGRLRCHAISRKEDLWDKVSRTPIGQLLARCPEDTIIDGELYVPGKPATSVITALNEGWPDLSFAAFAMPRWSGQDLRHEPWDLVKPAIQSQGFDTPYEINERDPEVLLELARSLGQEGYVLKNAHYSEWYKLKPQKTVDCFITGWKRGRGKYFTTTGSLQVSVWEEDPTPSHLRAVVRGSKTRLEGKFKGEVVLPEDSHVGFYRVIANVSGMTDGQRDEMLEMARRGELLGRALEVEYQSVAAKGKLQFPRFMRWREDKPIQECKDDQLC